MSLDNSIPPGHYNFLRALKDTFEPKIIYDIGSCVLHWTHRAKEVWPEAECVLFDAFEPAAFLYKSHRHFIGVLGDQDGKDVTFYQNNYSPTGNSRYKEIGGPPDIVFDPVPRTMHRLDTIVQKYKFPLPDLVKIDVQGCELDIMKGASVVLDHAKVLIVEMQHTNYNDAAPQVWETKPWIESHGWTCIAERFSRNGDIDADYAFVKAG